MAFASSLRRWGGGEKWMLTAATAMSERGHQVTLVVQPGSELARRGRELGLSVEAIRLGGIFDPRSLLGLSRVLRRRKVDVVCANLDKEIRLTLLAALLARRSIKLVARRGSPVPIKGQWHYRWQYNAGVDRLICNCRALVGSVSGNAPWFDRSKIRVIYNGVDATRLRQEAARADVREELSLSPATPLIACVGEVGARKAQDLVLDAADALRERFPDAVWLIVGEGDGRAALLEQAEARGLLEGGRVRFLGFRGDVPSILSAADLVVLPSRVEGFPNTLLEAMALGRAVAASDADGIPELVEHEKTGLLHRIDDAEGFTTDVARLLANPALREQFGDAGTRRAEARFRDSLVMDELEACLCHW